MWMGWLQQGSARVPWAAGPSLLGLVYPLSLWPAVGGGGCIQPPHPCSLPLSWHSCSVWGLPRCTPTALWVSVGVMPGYASGASPSAVLMLRAGVRCSGGSGALLKPPQPVPDGCVTHMRAVLRVSSGELCLSRVPVPGGDCVPVCIPRSPLQVASSEVASPCAVTGPAGCRQRELEACKASWPQTRDPYSQCVDTGGTWGGVPENLEETLGPALQRKPLAASASQPCPRSAPTPGAAPPCGQVPAWQLQAWVRDALRSFTFVDLLASLSSSWPWMVF